MRSGPCLSPELLGVHSVGQMKRSFVTCLLAAIVPLRWIVVVQTYILKQQQLDSLEMSLEGDIIYPSLVSFPEDKFTWHGLRGNGKQYLIWLVCRWLEGIQL